MSISGIPEGATVERLIFDPESVGLVALVDMRGSDRPRRGIFYRLEAGEYVAVVSPDDESQLVVDAIPAAELGGVLFSVFGPEEAPKAFKFDRVDLFTFSNKIVATILRGKDLQFPRHGFGWVVSLLHLGEGGRVVFARVGFQENDAGGDQAVPYYIARVELASGRVELVVRLARVHY